MRNRRSPPDDGVDERLRPQGALKNMQFEISLHYSQWQGLRGASYRPMRVKLVAIGATLGLQSPPLTSTLLGIVRREQSGVAAGALNAIRQVGSVLGIAQFGGANSNTKGTGPAA